MTRNGALTVLPRPSKRFGQNFLYDQSVSNRIIQELAPQSDETILEIGPGRGALTDPLLKRTGTVVALEFDLKLIGLLSEKFGRESNFRLVQGDALTADYCRLIEPAKRARVVANLPYNIGTAILQRLIQYRACLPEMVLMLQSEVVERIMAAPKTPERGFLSVFVQAYCETEKLFDVAPTSFRPVPKVWSTVIRLSARSEVPSEPGEDNLLWRIVSAGFAQRRKTMLNNLRSAPPPLSELLKSHGGASIVLCRAGVELQRRAETLTLEEWRQLAEAMM